jgi:hypothetical protein
VFRLLFGFVFILKFVVFVIFLAVASAAALAAGIIDDVAAVDVADDVDIAAAIIFRVTPEAQIWK